MSYEVFARKYRPQTFDDVVGQEHITRTLRNALEGNRLAHAYIFVGPRGTGKTSTARILAKSLNCQNTPGPTIHPCGTCDSCREIAGGNSLDVLEFDAASNTQVDKVREIIIDNVKYAPTRGRYKIYIVDEVHMLSASSFNALLKTLEEPPAHVKFIFATTDVQKVPTTILSRCQRFDLKRIATGAIAAHLQLIAGQEKITLAPAAAEAIARGAEGGMRDAESMLDQLVAFCGNRIEEADVLSVFGLTGRQAVVDLSEQIITGDVPAALAGIHAQAEAGRDLSRLMGDLIGHFRNLLVAQADSASLAEEHGEEAVTGLCEQCGRVKTEKLLELIEQFASAEQRMRWAPNRKMHFEVAIIRAIQTLGQATLNEVLETLTAMRGGGAPAAPSAVPPHSAPAPAPRAIPPKPTVPKLTEAPKPLGTPRPAEVPKAAETARAEETLKVAEPIPPAAPEPPPVEPPPAELDLPALWLALVQEVRQKRPLIRGWVEAGQLARLENGFAVLAFPEDQAAAAEYCQMASHRKFLEEVLSHLAGRAVSIKTEVRAGLQITPPPPPEPVVPPAPRDKAADFHDDPLIRKALDLFHAEIQPA